MEITEYDDGRDLITMEALYQIVRELYARKRVMLSRREFCSVTFPLVTTCDGLLALVKRGLPINLLLQTPAPLNSRLAARNLQ